ncbi:hypothetical protein OSJ77_11570 [Phyllobacterium sp. 0TCS1.6C]|uniref:hypothetical protein n=1 Tax=unclassified Phyllobacterium TaxID=2638441 RepID=UPI002264896A|nr:MULTISPECIES: hypothetical protein [unclassified Phyllobacterium]MCX8280833.1 hypothetical protein [Phyllobacterium sp. 0TCS1.6C]MCX8295699.1 hypothetical protein [Phyllobacterium sp. 0TCS1.6A]
MIQSALYFALGFLAATLLVLLIAPPVWRRAAYLTRKRVEAETPLTLNEIQAQRDGLRAEHAMAERRLELDIDRQKQKLAQQLAGLSDKERELERLAGDIEARDRTIEELQGQLATLNERIEKSSATNNGHERLLEQRASELELLHRRLASVATNADGLKIEVVAQSARIDNLTDDLKTARQERRNSEEARRKAEAELAALKHQLDQETKRSAEAEQQSSELLRKLTDAEARLARREKDLERTNERLRKVLADARKAGGNAEQPARGRAAMAKAEENELLREQMNTLASQVVAMVAALEGPQSQINALLAAGNGADGAADAAAGSSLADRIRALQEAASKAGKTAKP